jgi:hypothetical protein
MAKMIVGKNAIIWLRLAVTASVNPSHQPAIVIFFSSMSLNTFSLERIGSITEGIYHFFSA